MKNDKTFAIVKPDAVSSGNIGKIVSKFEEHELKVIGMRMILLSAEQARSFYAIHSHRPFFSELIEFMTSGPVVVLALEGENAVQRGRDIIGHTNPAEASPGTIRAEFGRSIDRNAVHGSDSPENAKQEMAFFFKPQETFI